MDFTEEELQVVLAAKTAPEFLPVFPPELERKQRKPHHKSSAEGEASMKKAKKNKSSHSKKYEKTSSANNQPKITDSLKTPGAANIYNAIIQPGATQGRGSQFKQLQTIRPHENSNLGLQTPTTNTLDKGKSPQTGVEEEENDPRHRALDDSFDPFAFVMRHFKLDQMETHAIEHGMQDTSKEAPMALLHAESLFS